MDLALVGKSVIVTGGASNIGRAIVLAFADEGASVTVADVDATESAKVVEEAAARGGKVGFVEADVTDLEQVENMVSRVRADTGAVDVLANAVGWDRLMYFRDTTPEIWDRIFRLNYLSVLNCTKAVLEPMVEQGHGAIVCVGSDASRQGEPREAVYGGMKAGVNSFMKTIAKEYGRWQVRCNVVCPGVTVPPKDATAPTSMWQGDVSFTDEQLEKIAKAMPLRRLCEPEDVARAVVFLASDAAAGYITGQVLSVSGGYTMIG